MRNKRGSMILDETGWWLLALGVFILLIIAVMILTKSGAGAIEFIKNLLKFGR